MFGGYCTALGPLGWLLMVLVWTGMLAAVVWGISRLFPSSHSPPARQDHGDAGTAVEQDTHQAVR